MDIKKTYKYIAIILFILLIATLIKLKLNTKIIKNFEDTGNYKKEKIKCQNLCQDYIKNDCSEDYAVNFCKQRVFLDINGNRIAGESGVSSIIENYPYCEDGIYCFHIQNCECEKNTLDAKKCLEILCDYYKNEEDPMKVIREKIKWGSCTQDKVKISPDWWYQYYGFYSDECKNIERKEGIELSCVYYENYLRCETSCKKIGNLFLENRELNFTQEKIKFGTEIKVRLDQCFQGENIKLLCLDPKTEKIQKAC
jgi:hypothetical protein